mmetsp:Transcript_67593/g.75714  ORF Transcript_67593/g.75714 Transcript_67593/m.75714 type:complete len:547 (+) Transcript_67593:30-1670(+)
MRLSLWLVIPGQLFICLIFCAYSTFGKSDEDLSQYFYLQSERESHHVQEQTKSSGDSRPDFIYSSNYPNDRVVIYYAHWCSHCQHFQPKYKEFSNKVWEMSTDLHVLVETFAISCVPFKKLCTDREIHGFPTIMFFPANSINGTKIKYGDLHPHDVFGMISGSSHSIIRQNNDLVNGVMGISHVKLGVDAGASSISISDKQHDIRNLQRTPYFAYRSRHESFHDAHLSFDFALKTAIYQMPGPLPEKPKETLKKFLGVMQKTVPISSSMQPVIRDLLHDFESVASSSKNLMAIVANHPPSRPISKWSAASEKHGTGYTAGLWQLFHIMSIGLVIWNHLALEDDQKIIPSDMADILRDYVEHFFLCEECRLNFLSAFDACSYDRCNRLITSASRGTLQQYIQYPLWLFETHNALNVRLRKERIEQNVETEDFTNVTEILWPPVTSCRKCWLSEGRWNEFEIYKYMQESYWLKDDGSEVLRMLDYKETVIGSKSSIVDTKFDDDVVDGSNLYFIGPVCGAVLLIFTLWYRKRQYDKIGIHKKFEFDFP